MLMMMMMIIIIIETSNPEDNRCYFYSVENRKEMGRFEERKRFSIDFPHHFFFLALSRETDSLIILSFLGSTIERYYIR